MDPIRCFNGQAKPFTKFWNIREGFDSDGDPTEPEIELYGIISEYSWFDDDVTPQMFKDDLNEIGAGGPVTIRINSEGGDVIAASVIRSILTDYPGRITTRIDGLAASAAVAIALAGDRVWIQDSAYIMIHEPWIGVFWAILDIQTLKRMTDSLMAIRAGLVDLYMRKTGLSEDRVKRMLAEETWLSAREAHTLGFVDNVLEPTTTEDRGLTVNDSVMALYKNIPSGIKNKLHTHGDNELSESEKVLLDECKILMEA